MTVQLTPRPEDIDEIRLRRCQGLRARQIGLRAIREQNLAMLAESWAWYDMLLNEVARALPPETGQTPDGVPLTGNETNKP